MNQLIEYLSRLFSSWKFWIVIPPWDAGVRVRLGKHARSLGAGFHFRVPGIDDITLVNTRLRICTTPTQTLPGSSASKTRCVGASIGYRITDPLAAMLAYTSPQPALMAFVQATIASDRGNFDSEHCLTELRREFQGRGVEVDFVYALENVEVRTYRLINGGGGGGVWSDGSNGLPTACATQTY